MKLRETLVVAAVVAISLPTAGCSSESTKNTQERWTGLVSDVRFTWDASPGIDVTSGPSVPARAFVESMNLAQYTGNIGSTYPGFDRAVRHDEPAKGLWVSRPDLDGALSRPLVGTDRYRILRFDSANESLTATICNYRYEVAGQELDGNYSSAGGIGAGPAKGMQVLRVSMVPPPQPSQLPPQSGPDPAPSDDVFGDWRINGLLTAYSRNKPGFDEAWPTFDADQSACVAANPVPPARREALTTGQHTRSDFPTSPPSPGWPAPSQ